METAELMNVDKDEESAVCWSELPYHMETGELMNDKYEESSVWWSELPYHMETSELMNVDKNEEISVWWSELPYHLKEDILACLPLHSLYRFLAVSSEWNALF